ncbi:MAG: cupredoxin domain-containing protein [Patescibacteria group bacterium]
MKNKKIFLYILCCAALAAVLIGAGLIFSKKTTTEDKNIVEANVIAAKEFRIDAFNFGYSPDSIKVKRGEKVKIIINNTDTMHGIRIPELGLADNNILEFTAEKNGQFIWLCNNFCGEGHRQMQGTLIVE